MVGKAVTKNLPLRPGESVTSIFPTLIFKSFLDDARSSQTGSSALQAGHHGA